MFVVKSVPGSEIYFPALGHSIEGTDERDESDRSEDSKGGGIVDGYRPWCRQSSVSAVELYEAVCQTDGWRRTSPDAPEAAAGWLDGRI